jgi:hypothetical protein
MILSREKLSALAKPSHVRCHGTGIYGYSPGSGGAIICRCVWRALEKKGVDLRAKGALQEAIGKEAKAVAAPEEKAGEEVGAC